MLTSGLNLCWFLSEQDPGPCRLVQIVSKFYVIFYFICSVVALFLKLLINRLFAYFECI